MKEIKKSKGYMNITKTIDDKNRIVKLIIDSTDPENTYKLTSEYEYSDVDNMIHYSDSEGRDIHYEYDDLNRVIWKRSNTKDMIHYIYKEKTEEVIKMELIGDSSVLVIECDTFTNGSNSISNMVIETNDRSRIKDVIKYALSNTDIFNLNKEIINGSMIRIYITSNDKNNINILKEMINMSNPKEIV